MRAALGIEHAKRTAALEQMQRGLQPSFLAITALNLFDLKPLVSCPTEIHALKHHRPVLGIDTASAGSDGEESVAAVVRPVEHLAGLESLELGLKRIAVALSFRGELLGFVCELSSGDCLISERLEMIKLGDALPGGVDTLHELLRRGRVVPQGGMSGLILEVPELLAERGQVGGVGGALSALAKGVCTASELGGLWWLGGALRAKGSAGTGKAGEGAQEAH